RRPVAKRNVGEATDNVERMTDPKLIAQVDLPTAEGEAARRKIGADIVANRAKTFISDGIALGYRYDSPLLVPHRTPAPRDNVMEYHQTSRPGSRAPHAWLSEGRSTIDLFGKSFVLMRSGTDAPDPSGLVSAAKQRGVPLEIVNIADPAIVQAYEQPL